MYIMLYRYGALYIGFYVCIEAYIYIGFCVYEYGALYLYMCIYT